MVYDKNLFVKYGDYLRRISSILVLKIIVDEGIENHKNGGYYEKKKE